MRPQFGSRLSRGLALAMALVALGLAAPPAFAQRTTPAPGAHPSEIAAPAEPAARADDGARVVAQQFIDLRILDLTIDSPALGATAKVRLLLPPDWSRQPYRRWPVLYLLHPAFVDYTGWTQNTDVEALTAAAE